MRLPYSIALVCLGLAMGLLFQIKSRECVAQQLSPAPTPTAIAHHSGNGHPVP